MEGIEEISVSDSNSGPQKELSLGFRSPDPDPHPHPHPAEEIRVADEFRNLDVNENRVDEDGGHNLAMEEEEEEEEEVMAVKEENREVLGWNEHGSEENGGTESGIDGDREANGVNRGSNEDQKEHEGGDNGEVESLAAKGGESDRESKEDGKGSENEGWKKANGNGHHNGSGNGDEDDYTVAAGTLAKMWRDGEVTGGKRLNYPLRPEAEDCSFYIRTGMCKFGMNCKFNHPFRRKSQVVKGKVKEIDEFPERPGQEDCKYYLKTGACKYGKACRYNHTGRKSAVAIVNLNFLGLPIRPGEKECSYYMRTGACKYGSGCRFNHPDPVTGGWKNTTSDLSNSLGGASESIMAPWSSQRPLHDTASRAPTMFPSSPSNPEWNGYQASLYSPERSMYPTPSYVMNNSTVEMNAYPQQQQMLAEKFPQRPGQPECSYFLKTGDCKYGSSCKYHHPKKQPSQLPPCSFSEEGLPLRPDQSTCAYYDRYGICKFGPACKFDHPVNHSYSPASCMTVTGQSPYFGNPA